MMKLLALLFAIAVSASPATFDDLAARAKAAREANHASEAIELYQQALKLKPAWQEGWWFLGTLSYDADQYKTGARAFAEFVKLEDKAAAGWAFLGLCEFEIGEYQNSLDHSRRALAIGGDLDPSVDNVLRFHEALLLTKLGLFDQATSKLIPFVRKGVRDPTLTAGIGLNALREPLLPAEVPPAEMPRINAAGNAAYLWMAGNINETQPAFRALVETFPTGPGIHYLYATFLITFRPAEEAVAELRRELEVNPHSADARAMIALLMVRAGLAPAAEPLAQQAAVDGPNSPMAQYTLGLILMQSGDLPHAIDRLESAERLDPANVEYHMGLAAAYSKAGRHDDAMRERKTSIQIAKQGDPRAAR